MILILVSAQIARADEYDLLFMEFDARSMSEAEKRYLQAGLTLEGHYRGLIDGAWGNRSQKSLEAYVAEEFPDADPSHPLFIHLLGPLISLLNYVDELGWDDRFFEDSGISLAAPWGILHPVPGAENYWTTDDGLLNLRYIAAPAWRVAELHANLLTQNKAEDEPPYLVRRSDRMVTSVQFADGGVTYLRSDLVGVTWVSVLIIAAAPERATLEVIASGIQFGPPRNWQLPNGSLLARIIELGARFSANYDNPDNPATTRPAVAANQPPANSSTGTEGEGPSSTGTAFFVNNTDLVTAEHVIANCTRVALEDGTVLTLLATDASIDLAVLSSPKRSRDWLPVSNAERARLGERAYALGYPYYGVISTTLNLTTGNVSALSGIANDQRFISVSAPVQPGNSGGPLLNGNGEILGVVSARLSEIAMLEATGSLPQNVNYAVTSEQLIAFLNRSGVLFPLGRAETFDMDMGAPASVQRAVVPVLCW